MLMIQQYFTILNLYEVKLSQIKTTHHGWGIEARGPCQFILYIETQYDKNYLFANSFLLLLTIKAPLWLSIRVRISSWSWKVKSWVIIIIWPKPYDLHFDRCYGDISDNPELATIVQMLVLKTDKVPHKPPDLENQFWKRKLIFPNTWILQELAVHTLYPQKEDLWTIESMLDICTNNMVWPPWTMQAPPPRRVWGPHPRWWWRSRCESPGTPAPPAATCDPRH